MVITESWSLVEIVLLQDQHGVSMYRGWVAAKVVKVGWGVNTVTRTPPDSVLSSHS
jgi:hypothetical protein